MESHKIAVFNEIIRTHNQISEESELWHCIQAVWDVSEKKAKKLARSYCNVISFYAIIRADEITEDSLYKFMCYCRDTTYKGKSLLKRDGFLRYKKIICKHYGFDLKNIEFDNYMAVKCNGMLDDKHFYNIKINQRWKGFHFMGGYVEDGELHISDSWNRGIAVLAKDVIPKKYKHGRKCFRWARMIA